MFDIILSPMTAIYLRPDYLRLSPQIRRDLETLAYYERPGSLKVTEQGFVRVSRTHALFQSLKGKLGFTNSCASSRVHYYASRLLYEVHLAGTDNFTDLIGQIEKNQTLSQRYQRVHALFSREIDELTHLKSDVTRDFTEMRPSFWRRRFKNTPPFNPHQFGEATLNLDLQAPTLVEGLEHFSHILKMDLDLNLLANDFHINLQRFLRNKTIPSKLKPIAASLQIHIAHAQFETRKRQDAYATHQNIIEHFVTKNWPSELVQRLFIHLLACGDETNFIAFYQKAEALNLPRKDYTSEFINRVLLLNRTKSRKLQLLTIALTDANPNDITAEFAHKMLSSSSALSTNLRSYFLLRQKAPHAIQNINPPWLEIEDPEEVLKHEIQCVTGRDKSDLRTHYHNLNHKIADELLKSITLWEKVSLKADEKRTRALNLFRITYEEAEEYEFDVSWIKPYIELLEFMNLKEELKTVINTVLKVCATRQNDITLFEYTLKHYGSICITEEDKKGLKDFYHKLNHQIANKLLNSITLWEKCTFQADEKRTQALDLFRTTLNEGEEHEFDVTWIKPYMELLAFMKLNDELDGVLKKVLKICTTRENDISLFEYVISWFDQSFVANHGDLLAHFLKKLSLDPEKKLELIEQLLNQGVHPALFFLKGEWLPKQKLQESLLAYRWAFTLAPLNTLDQSEPYYDRELLEDNQAEPTKEDVKSYRRCAIEAIPQLAL